MKRLMHEGLRGPYMDEAEFQKALLSALEEIKRQKRGFTYFEIENEEKVPGMPDILCILPTGEATFFELKHTHGRMVANFQKTQPLFYRRHKYLNIFALVWDAMECCVKVKRAQEVRTLSLLMEKTTGEVTLEELLEDKAVVVHCIDCGEEVIGERGMKPKELAKEYGYAYAGKAGWRCKECAKNF